MKTKEFDSVKMMREIRDKMSEEMTGMSFTERKAYIEARASRVREELEWQGRAERSSSLTDSR